MDKNTTIELFNSISKSIKYFRLKNELYLINKVIENNQTTEVKSKINIFGKMSNKIKDSKVTKYTEKKQLFEKAIAKFELDNSKSDYNYYYQGRLNKVVSELFKKDKLGIIKSFYALSIISDNEYDFEFDNESLAEISIILFTDKDKLNDLKNKLNLAYNSISGRMFSAFKIEDNTLLREATKNSLVFIETENKKYLESTISNDTISVTANLLNYGLLFGLGYNLSNKDLDKSFDKFVKISPEDIINLLTVLSFLIEIAYKTNKHNNDLEDELSLAITKVNNLRALILKQIIVYKTDVKINQEKLKYFNNFDSFLMEIVEA